MNELKPCPFCFGQADQSHASYPVNCVDCHATAPDAEAWNTRTAPKMKKWEWVESNAHGPAWKCKAFDALVYPADGEYHACIGGLRVSAISAKNPSALEIAQAACVAYVESKLKEWLA